MRVAESGLLEQRASGGQTLLHWCAGSFQSPDRFHLGRGLHPATAWATSGSRRSSRPNMRRVIAFASPKPSGAAPSKLSECQGHTRATGTCYDVLQGPTIGDRSQPRRRSARSAGGAFAARAVATARRCFSRRRPRSRHRRSRLPQRRSGRPIPPVHTAGFGRERQLFNSAALATKQHQGSGSVPAEPTRLSVGLPAPAGWRRSTPAVTGPLDEPVP